MDRKHQEMVKNRDASRKRVMKSSGESSQPSRYPAPMAATLIQRFATAPWIPKNVPRDSGGMIFEIMLVQELAVKPPPNPCQVSRIKVRIKPMCMPIFGRKKATSA